MEGKASVSVIAKLTELKDIETEGKSSECRYFKANALESHQADDINATIIESCDEKSIVFIDDSTSYLDISDYVELYFFEKSSELLTRETLRRGHITTSNAKRNFQGDYHEIKEKHLQLYLNEFVDKLIHRYFRETLFDSTVIAEINNYKHMKRFVTASI